MNTVEKKFERFPLKSRFDFVTADWIRAKEFCVSELGFFLIWNNRLCLNKTVCGVVNMKLKAKIGADLGFTGNTVSKSDVSIYILFYVGF